MDDDEFTELSTRAGAEKQAEWVWGYWAARGYLIEVETVTVTDERRGKLIHGVRSNLVGGQPPQI